jgi:hypothetical protein
LQKTTERLKEIRAYLKRAKIAKECWWFRKLLRVSFVYKEAKQRSHQDLTHWMF